MSVFLKYLNILKTKIEVDFFLCNVLTSSSYSQFPLQYFFFYNTVIDDEQYFNFICIFKYFPSFFGINLIKQFSNNVRIFI